MPIVISDACYLRAAITPAVQTNRQTTSLHLSDKAYRTLYPRELQGLKLGDTRKMLKKAFPQMTREDWITPKDIRRFSTFQITLSNPTGDLTPKDSDRITEIDCVLNGFTNWKTIAKSIQKNLESNFQLRPAHPPSNIESYEGIFTTNLLPSKIRIYLDPGLLKFSYPIIQP